MQKLSFAVMLSLLFIFLVACNSNEKTESAATKSNASGETPNYAYKASYSSSFEIGNTKNTEALLNLWKSWDDGDLSKSKDQFADSVYIYTRDGYVLNGTRDSVVKWSQDYRNSFSKVVSSVDAVFPIKSTDKNEDWVCIWGKEISTDKAGKVDSVNIQEVWRFNKGGKVDLMYQYGQAAKEMTMK